jgi:hypothetical protein
LHFCRQKKRSTHCNVYIHQLCSTNTTTGQNSLTLSLSHTLHTTAENDELSKYKTKTANCLQIKCSNIVEKKNAKKKNTRKQTKATTPHHQIMPIDPFTGERIEPKVDYSLYESIELEDDPDELDPELSRQLLLALQQQHTQLTQKTTSTIKNTRTVYSKKLKREIYATSWDMMGLDTKEGELPSAPIPTPPPSTPDTNADAGQNVNSFFDDEDEDGTSTSTHNNFTNTQYEKQRRQEQEHHERGATESNVVSNLSVLDWLQQRRSKELPLLQREALEREARSKAREVMKRKKYKVMLPEDVRGSTANVLHVIRSTIRSFTNKGMKAARTLYGKKISNPTDLFQAMDRDGDGDLTYDEVRGAMHRLGIDMTDLEFVQFIHRVDLDHSGSVDVKELEDAVMNSDQHKKNAQKEEEEARKKGPRPEKLVWRNVYTFLKKKGIKPTTLFHDIYDDGSGIVSF